MSGCSKFHECKRNYYEKENNFHDFSGTQTMDFVNWMTNWAAKAKPLDHNDLDK